jgi:hypothetical protein
MLLASDAIAALTLGPGMQRDKLVQAAGRMRQLSGQQSLLLVGTDEVTHLITSCCRLPNDVAVNASHVLQWVHRNTVESNLAVRCLWPHVGHFSHISGLI